VEGLTLRVEEGEVFGFLGPNGAGKTTTVRMLCCLISKTSGEARVGGYEVGRRSDVERIRRLVGVLPESVGLYDDLSAYRNLDYYGRMFDRPEGERRSRIEGLLRTLDLWERRDAPVATFSKGVRQRLAIARALVHDPQVVFLDEPTANLDPESAKAVREFILGLKKEGKTVFINTHNLDEAQKVCDRVGILKTRLVAVGATDRLLDPAATRRTVVRLSRVDAAVLAAVRTLGLGDVVVDGDRVVVGVADPDEDNPRLVRAIVGAGGRVRSVSEAAPTLEDVYLRLVGGGRRDRA